MMCVSGWWIPDSDDGKSDAQLNNARNVALARQQIETVLAFLPQERRLLAVQGGARCGLWPWLLADYFQSVVAFEADHDNCECAEINLASKANAQVIEGALARKAGAVRFRRSLESNGMHFVDVAPGSTGNRVRAFALDDLLDVGGCDAIFLDVEGYELDVLRGAERTLRRFHPVIIAEENALIRRYGRARGALGKWLTSLGYRQVGEFYTHPPEIQFNGLFHGSDLIFAYKG